VQHDILAAHPTAKLRVYAVWFNMLWGDSRGGWDSTLLADQRVTHYWDAQRQVGSWLGQQLVGDSTILWDHYLLFGPDARWEQAPGPLLSEGGTVVATEQQLTQAIGPLLAP